MARINRRILATALLLAGVVLAACGSRPDDAYETSEVAIGDVRDVVPAVGSVRATSQIEVRADTPGRVIAVLVEPNASVRAGDVLARIQPDRLSLDVDAARAEQAAAQASVREAQARAEQAQRMLSSRQTLASQGFISAAGLSQAEGEARAARASVERAQADAARAATRLRSATGVLGDVLIRAPSDGFVLSRAVEIGQVVAAGGETPLFIIASDTRQVMIEALVAEPDIGRVTQNARIAFTVEAYPRERFVGRLRDVLRAPRTDRNFISYPVLIEAQNPDGKLFPGMTAAVEFIHADARSVLRIPVEALYFRPENYIPTLPPELKRRLDRIGLTDPIALDGAEMGNLFRTGRQRVFVMSAQGPRMRAIRIGAESSDFVEVTEGLKAGDRVVTALNRPGADRP